MAFHAGITRLGGGYAGVDVFYVLSGFLITGLLLREVDRSGSISLPASIGWWAPIARPALAATGVPAPAPSLAPGEVDPAIAAVLGTPRSIGVPMPSHGPLPPTIGGTVPSDLRPPLLFAREDQPEIYRNGCVASYAETKTASCVYGRADSATTVMHR